MKPSALQIGDYFQDFKPIPYMYASTSHIDGQFLQELNLDRDAGHYKYKAEIAIYERIEMSSFFTCWNLVVGLPRPDFDAESTIQASEAATTSSACKKT